MEMKGKGSGRQAGSYIAYAKSGNMTSVWAVTRAPSLASKKSLIGVYERRPATPGGSGGRTLRLSRNRVQYGLR